MAALGAPRHFPSQDQKPFASIGSPSLRLPEPTVGLRVDRVVDYVYGAVAEGHVDTDRVGAAEGYAVR